MPRQSTLQRTRWAGMLASSALGITFVLSHSHLHGPSCLIRTLFHVPCPGCGLTRSLELIWQMRPGLAFRYHPLGIPCFGLCLVLLFLALMTLWPGRPRWWGERLFDVFLHPRMQWMYAVLMLGFWSLRLVLSHAGFFLW